MYFVNFEIGLRYDLSKLSGGLQVLHPRNPWQQETGFLGFKLKCGHRSIVCDHSGTRCESVLAFLLTQNDAN